MQRKVMISCALTGSADTPARNPAVPVTPAEIARSGIDAAKAGAAIVHIHVRDPATKRASMDIALYREVVDRIRSSGTDVVINLTTGPGARFIPDAEDPILPIDADVAAECASGSLHARQGPATGPGRI